MEFNKNYKIMVYGPAFFTLLIISLVALVGFICMLIYGILYSMINVMIVGVVIVGVLLFALIWLTAEMCLYVYIDKEKIELKGYKGVLIKFDLNDVALIETVQAYKGDHYIKVLGNTTQNKTKKQLMFKGETIDFPASKKNIAIIKHFIPSTIPWTNKHTAL